MAKVKDQNIPGDSLIYTYDDDWYFGQAYRRALTESYHNRPVNSVVGRVRQAKHNKPANPDSKTNKAFGDCVRCCEDLSDDEKHDWYEKKLEDGDRCSWLDKCIRDCLRYYYDHGELPPYCQEEKELIVMPESVTVNPDEIVNYTVQNCQGDIEVDYGYGDVFDISPCVDGVASFKIKNWGIVGTHQGTVTDGKNEAQFEVTVRGVPECTGWFWAPHSVNGGAPHWWYEIGKTEGVVVNNGHSACRNIWGQRAIFWLEGQSHSSYGESISVDECWQILEPGECFSPQILHVKIFHWSASYTWNDCGGEQQRQHNIARFTPRVCFI